MDFQHTFVSVNGKKHETFNSIKKMTCFQKIKSIISKHKGKNKEGFKIGGQNALKPVAPKKPAPNKPAPNKPAPNRPMKNAPGNYAKAYNSARPTVYGEMLYSSCDDSEYGPVRLDSVVET